MAADIRPVLTLRPQLTRTFQLFDPYDPGRAKPPKQPVKSGVTPTSFMHQPRGVEGTRTSETGSESRFLPRGGCPGGWTLAPEIPGRAGRSSLRQLPTIQNSRAEPVFGVRRSGAFDRSMTLGACSSEEVNSAPADWLCSQPPPSPPPPFAVFCVLG
jgi:hypothetical protein